MRLFATEEKGRSKTDVLAWEGEGGVRFARAYFFIQVALITSLYIYVFLKYAAFVKFRTGVLHLTFWII